MGRFLVVFGVAIFIAACSWTGSDCHLDIGVEASAPGHEQDSCVVTFGRSPAVVFDVPACSTQDCNDLLYRCPNRDPQGPTLSCDRHGSEIEIHSAGSKSTDELVKAIGSTTIPATVFCGGVELADAGRSDAVMEDCEK